MHAQTAVARALRVVDERESTVRAWAFLDPERARAEAITVDARPPGALDGLVLGVKDVFDTGDQPTEYGSSIFAGHRPRADAGAVALLRAAGAVCLGKTVTAELACFHPGPTTNPHRATHTPGGSSMGSAAAVATGSADIALGTQTAGSVIRPASFCGVYGFKPTFGTVTTAGVKAVAPSLDTVGWFARSPEPLDRVRVVLTGRPPADLTRTWRFGGWDDADLGLGDQLRVDKRPRPAWWSAVTEAQLVVHGYEAVRSLAWEYHQHRELLSDNLQEFLDRGARMTSARYDEARATAAAARRQLPQLFAGCDVLLTEAAPGEAPAGLTTTGDPYYSRAWTLLGLPCLNVPGQAGSTGLPVGIQVGRTARGRCRGPRRGRPPRTDIRLTRAGP